MPRRLIALSVIVLTLGCATARPIPHWGRDTCRPDIVPMETPWNAALSHALSQLYTPEVRRDTGGRDLAVVAAFMPEDTLGAVVCSPAGRGSSTIYVSLSALERWRIPGPLREAVVARLIAHELAHVVLHLDSPTLDLGIKEREADELGIYYFERAGYDCLRWVWNVGDVRYRLGQADAAKVCRLAKDGHRPPRRVIIPSRQLLCPSDFYWNSQRGSCLRIGD